MTCFLKDILGRIDRALLASCCTWKRLGLVISWQTSNEVWRGVRSSAFLKESFARRHAALAAGSAASGMEKCVHTYISFSFFLIWKLGSHSAVSLLAGVGVPPEGFHTPRKLRSVPRQRQQSLVSRVGLYGNKALSWNRSSAHWTSQAAESSRRTWGVCWGLAVE